MRAILSSLSVGFVGLALSFPIGPAAAQTGNPRLENCRQTVGRPIVMACMQRGGGDLERCRSKATPAVKRCMAAGAHERAPRHVEAGAAADTGAAKLVILMPGAGGAVASDFLVRNKGRIGGSGVSTVVTTSSGQAASLSKAAAAKGRKVILVGMSRGSIDVANALAPGLRPMASFWFLAHITRCRPASALHRGSPQPSSFTTATMGASQPHPPRLRASWHGQAVAHPCIGSTIKERPLPTRAAREALMASSFRMDLPSLR